MAVARAVQRPGTGIDTKGPYRTPRETATRDRRRPGPRLRAHAAQVGADRGLGVGRASVDGPAASALFGQGFNGAGVHALHVNGVGGNDLLKVELRGGTHSNKLNLVDLQGIVLPLPPWPNKSGSWPRLIS